MSEKKMFKELIEREFDLTRNIQNVELLKKLVKKRKGHLAIFQDGSWHYSKSYYESNAILNIVLENLHSLAGGYRTRDFLIYITKLLRFYTFYSQSEYVKKMDFLAFLTEKEKDPASAIAFGTMRNYKAIKSYYLCYPDGSIFAIILWDELRIYKVIHSDDRQAQLLDDSDELVRYLFKCAYEKREIGEYHRLCIQIRQFEVSQLNRGGSTTIEEISSLAHLEYSEQSNMVIGDIIYHFGLTSAVPYYEDTWLQTFSLQQWVYELEEKGTKLTVKDVLAFSREFVMYHLYLDNNEYVFENEFDHRYSFRLKEETYKYEIDFEWNDHYDCFRIRLDKKEWQFAMSVEDATEVLIRQAYQMPSDDLIMQYCKHLHHIEQTAFPDLSGSILAKELELLCDQFGEETVKSLLSQLE